MSDDPFTQVYNEINKAFKAEGRFTVIDWDSSRNPLPDEPTDSKPEVQIRPSVINGQLGSSSGTTDLSITFDILINTQDMRLGYRLFPFQWIALRLLQRLKYNTLDALEWDGDEYVLTIELLSGTAGLSDPIQNRNIQGWTSLWQVTVNMQFFKEALES